MKRFVLIGIALIALVGAGYVAFKFGSQLRIKEESQQESNQVNQELRGTGWQNPPSVADVVLTKGDNTQLKLGDLKENITVVFFGYTTCPDICPLTMVKLAQIYKDLGEPPDLRIVLITVDPETDTPEVVQQYASNFHPAFLGLSGNNSQVATAIQSFYIAAQDLKDGTFSHTDALIILDRKSRLRLIYSQNNVDYLKEDLPKILAQNWE